MTSFINVNRFTIDFEIIEKKNIFGHFIFIKNNFKTIQKLFRSIIAIQKCGEGIYILVVENMQYSRDVFWNVPLWACSFSRRSLTEGPDQSKGI